MKSSAWSFGGVAIFIFVATIVYWFLSHEIVGTVALIMALLMCVMIWGYLLITLKSIGTPLEDDVDATIEDGAGVIGFFPRAASGRSGARWQPVSSCSARSTAGG